MQARERSRTANWRGLTQRLDSIDRCPGTRARSVGMAEAPRQTRVHNHAGFGPSPRVWPGGYVCIRFRASRARSIMPTRTW